MKSETTVRICSAALELLDQSGSISAVSMRQVAKKVGITPMAIYKHFPNRNELLKAATSTEYKRIAGYFRRANARKNVKGLRGMLGYLDYALDHPNLFQYMFSSARKDAYSFPTDLSAGRSPTMNIQHSVVDNLMKAGKFRVDDVFEVSLTIWSHAHGLIMLYLAGRIDLPRKRFRELYMRSLNRLLAGLCS